MRCPSPPLPPVTSATFPARSMRASRNFAEPSCNQGATLCTDRDAADKILMLKDARLRRAFAAASLPQERLSYLRSRRAAPAAVAALDERQRPLSKGSQSRRDLRAAG